MKFVHCRSPSDEMFAGCYDEDNWSERLHISLQSNGIVSEFTARLREDEVKKTWIKRLPQEVRYALLFQGAPDLIIKSCEPDKPEGMVLGSQNEGFDEDTVEDSKDLPSSQDSAESARIQIAHQMTNGLFYLKKWENWLQPCSTC